VKSGLSMIAKRIIRERAASSFGRLGRYILRDQGADGILARTADYILDREGGRAAEVRFTNCLSSDPDLALKEILATQAMNRRAKGDKTYHLVISFPPGERPPPEVLADIEETLCNRIGLGAHQRLSAVHLDTQHLHLHVAINKVHPESFRAIEPYYDKRRLMEGCVELEIKHGLTPTAHGMISKTKRLSERDKAALIETLKGSVAPQILGDSGPQNWDGLHDLTGRHGFDLKLRGAGLVFQSRTGGFRIRASSISGDLSLKALTDRLGPFRSRPERASDSLLRTVGSTLFQHYVLARAAAREAHPDRKAAQAFALVKASYERQARAIIEDRSLTSAGRDAAFRAFRARRQAAFDLLRQTWPRPPAKAPSFPAWPAYVRALAAQGDKDAIALLEAWRSRAKLRSKIKNSVFEQDGFNDNVPRPVAANSARTEVRGKPGALKPDRRIAAALHSSAVKREQGARSHKTRRARA
jgi:hypothetical protein